MNNLEGERAVSDVVSKRVFWTTKKKALVSAVSFCAVLGLILWKQPGAKREEKAPPPPEQGVGQAVRYDPPPPVPKAKADTPPPQAQQQQAQADPKPLPNVTPIQEQMKQLASVKARPPRMVSYAVSAPQGGDKAGANGSAQGSEEADGTSVSYKGARIVGGSAGAALDRNLLLMPGIIQCVLDTGINSTIPGPLLCHLDAPVISPGNVVLMEKGTQIIGSYSADIKQGQYRMSAVSATAYTPNGVPVPLGGPFADGLGIAGLEADNVDNHYLQRFGAAVLLQLVDSGTQIAQSALSNGQNSYIQFSSGGSGVASLSQTLLQHSIDIPPTITKNQGDMISLWILTPIDFSKAYKLRTR